MANPTPDRTGLLRSFTRRRVEADIAVHHAIGRLSRRTDIPPSKAMTVLTAALRSAGVSKRTLQRYWQPEVTALRQTLHERYRPPQARRRETMLAALAWTSTRHASQP